MIVWRKATEIRGTFVEYRCLADYAGIITDLKNNKEIPEYSSNVVYFSRSRKRGEVESKLMYSIINKGSKRADHYFIINPEYADASLHTRI